MININIEGEPHEILFARYANNRLAISAVQVAPPHETFARLTHNLKSAPLAPREIFVLETPGSTRMNILAAAGVATATERSVALGDEIYVIARMTEKGWEEALRQGYEPVTGDIVRPEDLALDPRL